MVGQQFTNGMNADDPSFGFPGMVQALETKTGRYPYMVGADYLYDPGYTSASIRKVNSYLIELSKKGGLATVSTHFSNPWTSGDCRDRSVVRMPDLYTPGNPAYDKFHADLDLIAEGFKELQDNGVVVLYRPLHEMTGTWFWWGGVDQTEYVSLWRHVHDYLTLTKGLNNILWVYSPFNVTWDDAPADRYYAGDEYVDIVGMDWYSDKLGDQTEARRTYDRLTALGKPFAFAEAGPDALNSPGDGSFDNLRYLTAKQNYPKASYFLAWQDWSGVTIAIVGNRNARQLMNSPNAITLPGD
jgi:mannan endo-1,4-beta-mannosidase